MRFCGRSLECNAIPFPLNSIHEATALSTIQTLNTTQSFKLGAAPEDERICPVHTVAMPDTNLSSFLKDAHQFGQEGWVHRQAVWQFYVTAIDSLGRDLERAFR